jgi:hypothetical protein
MLWWQYVISALPLVYAGWLCFPEFKHEWLRRTAIKVPEPVELPKEFVYDWVRDDGYLWTGPGDTAFWLEPETCDELAAWCARYRPTDYGLYAVSDDVRIEWIEPIPDPYLSRRYGLQNAYNQYNGLAQMGQYQQGNLAAMLGVGTDAYNQQPSRPYNAKKHSEWY